MSNASAGSKLTYKDLVDRLTDLEFLATLPAQGETGALCSSYDRASRYDEATGEYIAWDANGDNNGIIRMEGDRAVFAEMEGPGCIWRIWSAEARAGHVKIYLDGAETPVVDLAFQDYFTGKSEPFVFPELVYQTPEVLPNMAGLNVYMPIPYQKSCKIVGESGWGAYYHFNYSTFPQGTRVPTFAAPLAAEDREALTRANDRLSRCIGSDPAGARKGQETLSAAIIASPRSVSSVADIRGERAITALKVRINLKDRQNEMTALRELALRITWDDDAKPAVWSPLGDFFGTAPGANRYKSLLMGITDDCFYSYWYMPFASGARIELLNEGDSSRSVYFEITHAPLSVPVSQLGRFHAWWHRDAFLPTAPGRQIDWTMLMTRGRGRYCGVALEIWNPRGAWWGEGDEKFFVDGEKFPSTFGTGSEDYFGYAWCYPELFERPFHNQTISERNKGHISVNRWHVADNVPFQASFEGAIEKYFPNDRPALYACTAYWYQAPGGEILYKPVPVEDRVDFYVVPDVYRAQGVLEAEDLEIAEKTKGIVATQGYMAIFGHEWSSDAQLMWSHAGVGESLSLVLPVGESAAYDLRVVLTKAADFGIVEFSLDGRKISEPIDLYNPSVIPTEELSLGVHRLEAGQHLLRVTIVGANDNAHKAYLFGMDYVRLAPAG